MSGKFHSGTLTLEALGVGTEDQNATAPIFGASPEDLAKITGMLALPDGQEMVKAFSTRQGQALNSRWKGPTGHEVGALTVTELRVYHMERLGASQDNPRFAGLGEVKWVHHQVARLTALGYMPHQISTATGYSVNTLRELKADPAFQNLILHYAKAADASVVELLQLKLGRATDLALSRLIDKLEVPGAEAEFVRKSTMGLLDRAGASAAQRVEQTSKATHLHVTVADLERVRDKHRGGQVVELPSEYLDAQRQLSGPQEPEAA